MAASLINNKPAAIFLGNLAQHHPHYADIHALAQHIAQIVEAKFGVLGEAANSVGAYIAGAFRAPLLSRMVAGFIPADTQGNAMRQQMLGTADDGGRLRCCQAYILMNLEPELDSYNPQQTIKALGWGGAGGNADSI